MSRSNAKKKTTGPSRGKNSKQAPAKKKTAAKKNQTVNAKSEDKSLAEDVKNRAKAMGELIKDGFNYCVEGIKKGFNAVKGFFAGLWEAIKNIASKGKDFVKGFFDKETLQGYAGYAKMGFIALLVGVTGWFLGGAIIAAVGLQGLAYTAAGGVVVCIATEKATQHFIEKSEEVELQKAS